MRPSIAVRLAAGILVPAAMLLSALPALAADDGRVGIRLLEAPSDRADDPRAQVYIVDHVAPGTSFTRDIEVTSTAADPLAVELYAAASSVVDGGWRPLEGRSENDLTRWISVDPAAVTVTPDRPATVTVRFDVPTDAQEGEQYAVIWAQPPTSTDGDVRVVNRVGIRVYLSVGAGGESPTDFEIVELVPGRTEQGLPRLDAIIRNGGGRAIDLQGDVELVDGPGGAAVPPTPFDRGVTVPVGGEATVTVPFPADLPDGPWTANVTMQANDVERRHTGRLSFADDAPAQVEPLPAEVPERATWPLMLLALLLLLLVLAAIIVVLRRRRDDEDKDDDGRADAGDPDAQRPREPVLA